MESGEQYAMTIGTCQMLLLPASKWEYQSQVLQLQYNNIETLKFTISTAALVGTFGAGSGPIMLDDLKCNGDESSLLSCPNNGINKHNCRHTEDAGVICITSESQQGTHQPIDNKKYSLHDTVQYHTKLACRNSSLRVRNVPGVTSGGGGYLEVCINGTYSAICISGWNLIDAAVACRQLGEVSASMIT